MAQSFLEKGALRLKNAHLSQKKQNNAIEIRVSKSFLLYLQAILIYIDCYNHRKKTIYGIYRTTDSPIRRRACRR